MRTTLPLHKRHAHPLVFGQVIRRLDCSFENAMGGKWLGTLSEIAPNIARVAVLREAGLGVGMLGAIQAVMPSFTLPLTIASGRDGDEFERVIAAFGSEPNGGLIVLPAPNTIRHRRAIIASAAKHRVPTVYPYGFFVKDGGLISYGIVPSDMFRRAAAYVDAILKGAKPSDLPVQQPTKFEMVINLTTAKALGVTVPPTLLARVDEVIE